MIVTKEMAEKYLIKRRCYLITIGPNGDYVLTSTSVHWKKGMEVFEDQDECLAEIDRRRKKQMDSGNCPKCNYKFASDTEKDIGYLDVIGEAKGGKLYECNSCKSVWYKHPSFNKAIGYDAGLKDFLIEWGNRDMKPTLAMKDVLAKAGNLSYEAGRELYAVDVLFKNKSEFEPALIHLETMPPSQQQFNKLNWAYLDSVKEIRISPLAYSKEIAKYIMKVMQENKELVHIKSNQTGKVYGFEAHAGVFMPKELEGEDFKIVKNEEEKSRRILFYMPADRGGPDMWTMTKTTAVTILGDSV